MSDEGDAPAVRRLPEKARPEKVEPPRRGYSLEKKLQVVRETLAPGASVSVVARRHDINSNVVFRWRREHSLGELVGSVAGQRQLPALVPIGIVGEAKQVCVGQSEPRGIAPGMIEVETAAGIKVRVTGPVDGHLLSLVLAEMRGRR